MPSSTPTRAPTPRPESHTVQKGESLTSIALLYGTSVEALAQANGLEDPNSLQIGQEIAIPGTAQPAATATSLSVDSGTQTATAGPQPTATAAVTHTVQQGDTLSGIATQYGVTVQEIVDANDLESADFLHIGQVLVIPLQSLPSPTATGSSPTPTP